MRICVLELAKAETHLRLITKLLIPGFLLGGKSLGCVADDTALRNAMLFIFKRVPFGLTFPQTVHIMLRLLS